MGLTRIKMQTNSPNWIPIAAKFCESFLNQQKDGGKGPLNKRIVSIVKVT